MIGPMRTTTATNDRRLKQLDRLLRTILAAALQPGFFGSVGFEVSVQDGVVQHIRHKIERIEK